MLRSLSPLSEASQVSRRRKFCCSPSQVSRDDVGNLATLLGVLAALMLSFAMATQISTSTPSMIPSYFREVLCWNLEFGHFVVETLEHEDIGQYRPKFFNFTVQLGKDKAIDVRQQLLRNRADLLNEIDTSLGRHGCHTDKDWTAAVALVADAFPMEMALAWWLHNGIHPNDYQEKLSAVSVGVLTASVLWSVLIHVSLLLSVPAKDDAAFESWLRIGWPTLLLGHVLNSFGVVMALAAHAVSLAWHSPWVGATMINRNFTLLQILTPLMALGTILSVMAFARACLGRSKEAALMRQRQDSE